MKPAIQLDNAVVYHGSNLDVLPTLPDNSVDSIVTDPPYELGFMGKKWDSTGIAYSVELWRECLRVLKPGGHLLAFGGSRTWHRLAVAIEDSGFEVRDSIAWLYGSGFPKSLDISKAIDKVNGDPNRLLKFTLWFRTTGITVKQVTDALRTAKLISENGTMASHYFAPSNAGQPAIPTAQMWQVIRPMISEVPDWVDELVERIEAEREVIGQQKNAMAGWNMDGTTKFVDRDITLAATEEAKKWSGWGTALKPAFEPVVVARKPLIGTVAANVLEWGVGGLNIDASRIGRAEGDVSHAGNRTATFGTQETQSGGDGSSGWEQNSGGRWPANIILDEFTAGLLDEQSGNEVSRFFYQSKASKKDRNEGLDELEAKPAGSLNMRTDSHSIANGMETKPAQNFHPTVKPTDLMRYLIKLVTPPGGTVLDPFTGSGSTGKAALLEGFDFIGIELTDDYLPIIAGRLAYAAETFAEADTPLFD